MRLRARVCVARTSKPTWSDLPFNQNPSSLAFIHGTGRPCSQNLATWLHCRCIKTQQLVQRSFSSKRDAVGSADLRKIQTRSRKCSFSLPPPTKFIHPQKPSMREVYFPVAFTDSLPNEGATSVKIFHHWAFVWHRQLCDAAGLVKLPLWNPVHPSWHRPMKSVFGCLRIGYFHWFSLKLLRNRSAAVRKLLWKWTTHNVFLLKAGRHVSRGWLVFIPVFMLALP